MAKLSRVLYFGCSKGIRGERQAGHFLHGPGLTHVNRYDLPPYLTYASLDCGTLQPQPLEMRGESYQAEGIAKLSQLGKYSVLAFWDRSGDQRANSHSTFVLEGETLEDGKLHYHEALKHCREAYPEIFERIEATGVRIRPLS